MGRVYRRIRGLREERNLTQTQLANHLHISQTTYSRYENGRLDIPSEILLQLADFYHVTTDYILGRSDSTDNKSI